MIGTLSELVAIPSVKGKAVPGKPYGEECAKVLDKMLNIASSFGFRTENHKNRVGTIDFIRTASLRWEYFVILTLFLPATAGKLPRFQCLCRAVSFTAEVRWMIKVLRFVCFMQ